MGWGERERKTLKCTLHSRFSSGRVRIRKTLQTNHCNRAARGMPRLVLGLNVRLVRIDDRRVADGTRLVGGEAILVGLAECLRHITKGITLTRCTRLWGCLFLGLRLLFLVHRNGGHTLRADRHRRHEGARSRKAAQEHQSVEHRARGRTQEASSEVEVKRD